MNREEFISELNERIKNNPDHNDIISYYFELISDKMDSGYSEEDAVASLGSLDEIVKNIEGNKDDVEFKESNSPINFVAAKSESTNDSKDEKLNDNPTNKTNSSKELSGGRKFWYVIWCIATVLFCIISVCVFIFTIIGIGVGSGLIIYGALQLTAVKSFGFLFLGIGLFILGASLAGIYYANFLRKYMFSNRLEWNKKIRDNLAGE